MRASPAKLSFERQCLCSKKTISYSDAFTSIVQPGDTGSKHVGLPSLQDLASSDETEGTPEVSNNGTIKIRYVVPIVSSSQELCS